MYESHIKRSLTRAENGESNIDPKILEFDGMSGWVTRHFYNNICSLQDTKYLEIGSYSGSTLCSAICNNKIKATAIDNWSQFDANAAKQKFNKRVEMFKEDSKISVIEDDCWNVQKRIRGKFNVYLYDGPHGHVHHRDALLKFHRNLTDNFIFIVDDWNWLQVRNGTFEAIEQLGYDTVFFEQRRTGSKRIQRKNGHPRFHGRESKWHNGIGIFELKKSKK